MARGFASSERKQGKNAKEPARGGGGHVRYRMVEVNNWLVIIIVRLG